MNITELKVGYRRYEVGTMPASEANDEARHGDINHRIGRIRISGDLPPVRAAFTLIHETLHALFEDIGLDWPREEEERMVERLTPRLAAFLADNPEQVRELLAVLCRPAAASDQRSLP